MKRGTNDPKRERTFLRKWSRWAVHMQVRRKLDARVSNHPPLRAPARSLSAAWLPTTHLPGPPRWRTVLLNPRPNPGAPQRRPTSTFTLPSL